MGANIIMLIIGVLLAIIGAGNIRGNIESVHWYNRRRITEEIRPLYGKAVGIGTLIIAGGLILSAVLNMLSKTVLALIISGAITLVSVIIGIAFILYAQIKYNKGFF